MVQTNEASERRRLSLLVQHGRHILARRQVWIATAIVLFYLAGVTPQWEMYPDSAAYLLLSQSLSAGEGYAICGVPHGKYPPGLPVLLAGMTQLGLDHMLCLNLLMCSMTLVTLACVYGLLREYTTPRYALLVMVVLAFSFELCRFSHAILSEVPFLMLVTMGLWGLKHGLKSGTWHMEAGVLALVMSCWVRVLGIPLALAASLGLLFESRQTLRRRVCFNVALMIVGAAVTGWWLFARDREVQRMVPQISYAIELSVFSTRSILDSGPRLLMNFLGSGTSLGQFFTHRELPNWLAALLFWPLILLGGYFSYRKREYLLVTAAAGYLAALFLIRTSLPRYYLPIGPILILYAWYGLRWLVLATNRSPLLMRAVTVGVVLLFLCLNVPPGVELTRRLRDQCSIASLKQQDPFSLAADFLQSHCGNTDTFASIFRAHLLAYMSGVRCVLLAPQQTTGLNSSREVFTYLEQTRAKYIVSTKDRRLPPDAERIRQALHQGADYRLLFSAGEIEIFGRPAQMPTATAQEAR